MRYAACVRLKLRPWTFVRSLRVRTAKLMHAARAAPAPRAKIGSPYDDIDDEFHDAYARARTEIEHDVPVFIVLADALVFLRAGQRQSWSITPATYQLIKMVSHAPLAIFSSLQPGSAAAQVEDKAGRRVSLRAWIDEARAKLSQHVGGLGTDVVDDLRAVLEASSKFLEQPSEVGDVDAFARALGPTLLRLIDAATQLQLDALHAHVEQSLRELSAACRARLEVIVTGNHQARERSLPMQYFLRRLHEDRVTYAEGVDNEQGALALVGIRRLDSALAAAFFDDPKRMQRDLLGDSAEQRLAHTTLTPIA
jgi:hypothetical protein